MAVKAGSEERAESQQLLRQSKKQRLQFFAAVELCVQAVLAWFFQLVLLLFCDLQDAFLAIGFVRRLVAFAFAPRCQAAVMARVRRVGKLREGFDDMQYSVSAQAKELLVHAGMHALLTAQSAAGAQLPQLGRILLQTGVEGSGKFQEAVAAALARELKASLLVVDEELLDQLAREALGAAGGAGEQGSGVWAYILSFWLSGGKVAFAWSVLRRLCARLEPAVVVLVKDVEATACGSAAGLEAFVDAFGSLRRPASPGLQLFGGARGAAVVLLGGSSLRDRAPVVPLPTLRSLLEKVGEDSRRPGPSAGPDDTFSLLPELGLPLQDDKQEPHELLDGLFMTRVRLEPPASGPAAQQHARQMAADAADLVAEHNLRELASFGLQRALLPPPSSALLRKRKLATEEWSKVVAWAKSMDAILKTRDTIEVVKALCSKEDAPQGVARSDTDAVASSIRRSSSAPGITLDDVSKTLWQLQRAARKQNEDPAAASKSVASATASAASEGVGLSERALEYGMRMLDRGGLDGRAPISADNSFESRLLSEVVSPEDAGSGFAEVGALGDAKDALREIVQLPLQHPEIFESSMLAQLCRGVLLFGPPGTGKTMLARAVAAECGASFLALHPSAVASKWVGDGVRYVRAAFSLAAKLAPCVVFLDEVDALLARRGGANEHETYREMKNEAMAQWDGIRVAAGGPHQRVVVMGATNRPQDLDEAVLRRFSRRIFCDVPDRKARKQILEVMLAGERLSQDVDLGRVADRTAGYSGSDLRDVCTAAAMRPVRELLKAGGSAMQKPAAAENGLTPRAQAGSSPSLCDGSEVSVPQDDAAAGAASAGEAQQARSKTESRPAESRRRTEMMSVLLSECERMAASASGIAASKLRPLSASDFEEAVGRTAPSMDDNSAAMDELRAWNAKYGEGSKGGRYTSARLSYFI